jgi:hypothetical protein
MDTTYELDTPLTEGGIPTVNFFNGRLLSAKDLIREQEARRLADWRLGEALGAGVAWGLEVAKHPESDAQNPRVTVQPGLAVNRAGQVLKLEGEQPRTVHLLRKSSVAELAPAVFGPCGRSASGTYVAGPGLYVLTIAPGAAAAGKAPTNGHDQYGGACNTDVILETIQFRLVALDSTLVGLDDPTTASASESLFRNRLASYLFRAGEALRADPRPDLRPEAGTPPLAALAGPALTDCDVPLALIYWTLEQGIRFVDPWAVRRAIAPREADRGLALCLGALRRAEGECFPRQFQAQLDWLLQAPGVIAASLTADQAFAWLPPAGVLPVGSGGVDWRTFLGPMAPPAPKDADAALIPGILLRALDLEAVEVPDFVLAAQPGTAPAPLEVYRIPQSPDFVVFARSERSRVRVFLSPAAARNNAEVTVERDNPPIATAAVKVDGAFVASDLEPGSHSVEVEAPGFVSATKPASACAGRTVEVSFALAELPKGALLINLADENTGAAITASGTVVRAVAGSSSTSGTLDGSKWRIANLGAGAYTVVVSAPGYRPESYSGVIVNSGTTSEYTLRLEPIPEPDETESQCVITRVHFLKSGLPDTTMQLCPSLQDMTMVKDSKDLLRQLNESGLLQITLDPRGTRWLKKIAEWLISQGTSAKEVSDPQVYLKPPAGPKPNTKPLMGESQSAIGVAVFGNYVVPLHSGGKEA